MNRRFLAAAFALLAAPATAEPAPTPFDTQIGESKAAMMADPSTALVHAQAAERIAAGEPDARARALDLAQAKWLEGEALTRIDRVADAKPVVAEALATVARLDPNGKLHGDLLGTDAVIKSIVGELPAALGEFQSAYGIFVRIGDARSQAKVLQRIGSIYFDARDYPRVLKYYAQSAEVYKGDPALTISAYNNLGDTLKEMHRFRDAEAHYRIALKVTHEVDSAILESKVLNNIASAEYWAGDLAKADATADRALARAKGLETDDQAFIWGVKAQVALARHDYPATKAYLARTFAGTDPTTTTLAFREFHDTAFKLYSALGDDRSALIHLRAFKRLDDQAREVAASTNAALIGARFDFANQELRISKLKAGQLQRDIAFERSRAKLRSTILFGALGAALVIAVGTLLAFFSIRRSRNEVRDANGTLSEVNAELSKALTAKTRFLATTSHEIRTPLNGILGMTQVMLHDRTLPAEQRDRVRIVHDAGTTMKALVDDILDVAKIETGKLTIEKADVELRPLIEGVARLWADEAAAKGLAFDLMLGDCPARMIGDARRIRQIVFNLMSNAVKFTEQGSVRVAARAEGEALVLEVIDTGIGIAPEQQQVVFESFHQVDGDLTRKHGGTGLGLAICRELAQAMDGEMMLTSEPGRGSTFAVRLPLGCPVETVSASTATWPDSLETASILIVEANALTRSVLTAALAQVGGKVQGIEPDELMATLRAGRVHHVVANLAALAELGDVAAAIGDAVASQDGQRVAVSLLATELPAEAIADQLRQAGVGQILKRPLAVPALIAALAQLHLAADAPVAVAA